MAVNDTYSVRKRGQQCEACGRVFVDRETIHSRLVFEKGEYLRIDYCKKCKSHSCVGTPLSSWKTVVLPAAPPKEETLKKENAESLLRKLIDDSAHDHANAIYILTLMLERKKLFAERDVQTQPSGKKIRIYEHKKSGETFLITDPNLKLTELQHVQQEVVLLLGGAIKNKSSNKK